MDVSHNGSIFDLLEQRQTSTPRDTALVAPGRAPLSYGDLVTQIRNVAALLAELGLKPADRVAVVLPNGLEMATCLMGVMARCACAPLNPAFTAREFEFYLQDLAARLIILPQGSAATAREVAGSLGIRTLELDCRGVSAPSQGSASPHAPPGSSRGLDFAGHAFISNASALPAPAPEATALLLHTSGTTSRPKLVPLSHGQLAVSAENIRTILALTNRDVSLNVMPLFHIHGLVAGFLAPLTAGASVVCAPSFDPRAFLSWIEEHRPTYYSAVPTIHQRVLAVAESAASVPRGVLRFIRSSSASLPPTLLKSLEETFDCPVIEAYGMTEAAHQMASNPLPPRARKPGTVGIAAGPEIAIMTESGALLPRGERGEIVIRGRSVFKGYESNPKANAESFHDGWFRTGDSGFLDEDGYLTISGRIKEIINRAGEKISPREIDEALLEHAAIAQAVAFPVPHPSLGEDVVAAVVLRPGAAVTADELRQFTAARLAAHKVPQQFVFLPELPKGPSGKVQRIGMAEKLRGELSAEFVDAETDAQRKLVAIWKTILELPRVGIRDNFFQLGGDSIQSVMMASMAREAGIEIMPRHVDQYPTIAELAQAAETAAITAVPTRPASTEPVSLLPLQSYLLDTNARVSFAVPLATSEPIDPNVLRAAAKFFVAHHDALRTQVRQVGDDHEQRILPAGEPKVVRLDLSSVAREHQQATFVDAIRKLGDEVRLDDGTGVAFVDVDLGHMAGVVVMVHHFVADEYSRAVMSEDLATVYEQIKNGEAPSLGPKMSSVTEWAAHQWKRLRAGELDHELAYWRSIVRRFPKNAPDKIPAANGDDRRDITLDADLSARILATAKNFGVQLPELVATALARTMMDCTENRVVPVMWTLSGRTGLPDGFDLARTVGYLPTYAPTLIELPEGVGPRAMAQAVRAQLRGLPENGTNYMWLARFKEPALWEELPSEPFRFNYVGHLGDVPEQQSRTLNTYPASAFAAFVGQPLTKMSLKRRIKVRVGGGKVILQIIATKGLYGRTTAEFLDLVTARLRELVA